MIRTLPLLTAIGAAAASIGADAPDRVLERRAMDTLTAVELDVGETLRFTLASGAARTLTLEDTSADVLLTNLERPKEGFHGGATAYAFRCRVRIDGQPMEMLRYVPTQESFYEPYVVNGLRIWFDGVKEIGAFVNENHGPCFPAKQARFAVQDASLPICPQEIRPWYPNPDDFIDVRESYNGDDVWMGPYQGADAHGGLDVNMPVGTPIWAPIGFDDHFYFNSLQAGDNNNRHRAIRRWPDGQVWALQCHHVVRLLVPERTAIPRGTHYAVAAGVLTGSHPHSHFTFKVGEGAEEILLDPWILFRQIFENNKRRSGAIRARIAPVEPARTGEAVAFSSSGSAPGATGVGLETHWDFGDGGGSLDAEPTHVFARPGIYPVALVVDDGAARARSVQHITVDGEPVGTPVLALDAPEDPAFRLREPHEMDTYGLPVRRLPRTVHVLARPRGRARPDPRTIRLVNAGRGTLAEAAVSVAFAERDGWLRVDRSGAGDDQCLELAIDAARLHRGVGLYHAVVTVDVPGAANSPQAFRVRLEVPRAAPATDAIVDNDDPGCEASPYFWFAPRFHVDWAEGHGGTYLTNGGRDDADAFVRYTPDLAAGRYEVRFAPGPRWDAIPGAARALVRVRVTHRGGVETLDARPARDPIIGTFDFDEGADGHVEIRAAGSSGTVVADAVRFRKVAELDD